MRNVGRPTNKTTFVLNRLITVCVIRSLFKVTVLFTGMIFLVMFTHLHGKKEDEAKLMPSPSFPWKHENVVLDGTSDPSAVVSDSLRGIKSFRNFVEELKIVKFSKALYSELLLLLLLLLRASPLHLALKSLSLPVRSQ